MSQIPKKIERDGQIFAHYIPSDYRPGGVNFMTPTDYSLQLGLIGHDTGYKIKDHIHNPEIHYKVDTTQEFLYLEQGSIEVTIYDMDWAVVDKVMMKKGDIILQVYGGHGFRILEPSYLIEVKQGPFPGDQLMKYYRPSEEEIRS